jgi:DNA invertase Pin-like site-specific DNA recombinase
LEKQRSLYSSETSKLHGHALRRVTMHVGYARVSTREQTIDLQVDALTQAGCTKVYTEVISGARAERPILAQVLETLRAGDVLVIWKLDRLGRSLTHLLAIVTDLMTRQVGLKSLNDPIDTTTPQGRLILNLFGSLAEFEREVIRDRTQAGLSAARARGRLGGARKAFPARPKRRRTPPKRCIARAG